VWDGVSFVSHGGALCKGLRQTISWDGINATPDHEVMTNEGWFSLKEARSRNIRITRTGIGRKEIRFSDNSFTKNRRCQFQFESGSGMHEMLASSHGEVSQYRQAEKDRGMPSLQWTKTGNCSEMAILQVPIAAKQMYKSEIDVFSLLRRAWNRIQIFFAERCFNLGNGKFRNSKEQEIATRSDKQQWTLRAWKLAMGAFCNTDEQYEIFRREREIHRISEKISSREICGPHAKSSYSNYDTRGNCEPLEDAFIQTEREVWDIHNAGPLQRFTANGRLVHNCALILDHSDTTERLGFVTDIQHDELDDGKPKPKAEAKPREALPKECKTCSYLMPPRSRACPNCGSENKRETSIVEQHGELIELNGTAAAKKKAKKDMSEVDRHVFYNELLGYADEKSYKQGWAAIKYKERFGIWPPNNWSKQPSMPGMTTRSWIRSRMIKSLK